MQQLVVAVRCSAIAYTLMSLQLICVALHGNAGMVIRAGHHNWPIWFRPAACEVTGVVYLSALHFGVRMVPLKQHYVTALVLT